MLTAAVKAWCALSKRLSAQCLSVLMVARSTEFPAVIVRTYHNVTFRLTRHIVISAPVASRRHSELCHQSCFLHRVWLDHQALEDPCLHTASASQCPQWSATDRTLCFDHTSRRHRLDLRCRQLLLPAHRQEFHRHHCPRHSTSWLSVDRRLLVLIHPPTCPQECCQPHMPPVCHLLCLCLEWLILRRC